MRLRVNVDAQEAILAISKTLTKKRRRADDAMKESAYLIYDLAFALAAKKTGAMSESGTVTGDIAPGGQKRYKIEFDWPYAWEHEHWHSDKYFMPSTDDTEPRYLAKALDRTGGPSAVSRNISNAMRRI